MAGYDPYTDEDQTLDYQLRGIRPKSFNPTGQYGDLFAYALNLMADNKDREAVTAKKAALAEKSNQMLVEALKGAPDDVMALIKHPATRAEGLKLYGTERERARKAGDREQFFNTWKGMGQQVPSLQQLLLLEQAGPTEEDRAMGKSLREQFYPKSKQLDQLYPNSMSGGYGADPGALPMYASRQRIQNQEKANFEMIDVPLGDGRSMKMPLTEYLRRSGQSPQSPQLGGGVPTPTPTAGTGVGPLSGALSAMGGGAGSPPATPSGGLGTQEASRLFAMAMAQNTPVEVKARIMGELAKQGYQANTMPGQWSLTPPAAEPVATSGPQQRAPQFGVSDPGAAKFRELGMESGQKILQADREQLPKQSAALKTLQMMSELNQSGKVIGGPFPDAKVKLERGIAQLFGFTPGEEISISEFFDKLNLTQLRDSLKAYGSGTGISNLDLLTAQRTLPGRENSQEGRQKIIEYMMAQMMTNIENHHAAEAYFQKNRTLNGFVPQNYDMNGNVVSQQEMATRLKAIKAQKAELEKLTAETPVLKNAVQDVGEHALNFLQGGGDEWKAFAQGAGTAAAAIPVGGAVAAGGRFALPMARNAASAFGRFITTPGGGMMVGIPAGLAAWKRLFEPSAQ